MNKRSGFVITIVIFVLALGGFYVYLKKQQNPGIEPLNAVPLNTALVLEIKQPDKFFRTTFNKSTVFKHLKKLDNFKQLDSKIQMLDTLIKSNEKLNKFFNDKVLLISIHDIGKNEFHPLYVMSVSGRYEANQLLKSVETSWRGTFNITSNRYNQVKLYKIENNKHVFYYSYHNGLLLGSTSEILIEDAIRQAETDHGLQNDEGLNRIRETSGDHSEANIYLQFEYFQKLLNTIISPDYFKQTAVTQVGDWIELDLNAKNQTILLNGFAFSQLNQNRLFNLFHGQKPQQLKFLKFIPSNIEGFIGYGLSNYNVFVDNLRNFMKYANQSERFDVNRAKVHDVFNNDFEQNLSNIFGGEVVQVSVSSNETLFYLKTEGYRDGLELIEKALKSFCKKNNVNFSNYKTDYKIDDESVFPVFKMPLDYLPTRLFGPQFINCRANYVTVFDDYLIFGDSYKSLTKTIYDNVLQKTLAYDGAYSKYSNYLSTKVNFFGYVSLIGTGSNIEKSLTKKANDYFKKHKAVLHDFYALGWQFSTENELAYNNLLIRFQPSNEINAATEWETRLDTVIAFKPELMINHYTQEKEIFVQDEKNNVYLINSSGRVLWKKNIEAEIMSKVYQVDYYKNGKLQYLFNTKNKIHLLDRNGNFVERYPIKLSEKAAAPLAVFDYENNKNYRLFIPLVTQSVVAYNIEGKVVTGFKFSGTDNKIIAPIQYVRDNRNDYIIVTDQTRIYILDRRGNIRANPKIQFNPSKNNIFAYQQGNSNRPGRLVRTDDLGTIYYIYFDGKVEERKIEECSENHFFAVEDVTGDRISDFVFVDGNMLMVYGLTGNKIFKHKFNSNIKHAPAFYQFSSTKKYIGITETDESKIYLFNGDGEIIEGFPLTGKTRFSIGFLKPGGGSFSLIVGGNEYYLYNYKLN